MKRPPQKQGDIYSEDIARDEYGKNAENRPTIHVELMDVPVQLRHLVTAVERWAIPCDVTRADYFDKQPAEDISKFWFDVLPYVPAIRAWLDLQSEDILQWPGAAIHYLYFLKAHGEAWQPTADERQALDQRYAKARHERNLKRAIETASEAFKLKEYVAVIASLEPFEAELDKVSVAKLAYARKAIG
jgi:hypothetical protein